MVIARLRKSRHADKFYSLETVAFEKLDDLYAVRQCVVRVRRSLHSGNHHNTLFNRKKFYTPSPDALHYDIW